MANLIIGIFQTFIEILKLGKLPAFVISIISWVLLLIPLPFQQFISIDTITQKYRSYIGLCAVFFTVYFLLILIYECGARKIKNFRIERAIIGRLKNLSNDEKEILIPYIRQRVRTQYHSIDNGVANGLEAKHVLYQASSVGNGGFPYNIQDIAYDYLLKHPQLLELDKNAEEDTRSHLKAW